MADRRKMQDHTFTFNDRRLAGETKDPDCKGPTIVKFGLWPVLLLLITALAFLFLANSQANDRITKLETKLDYISVGMNDIKVSMKEIAAAMRAYEMRGWP